MTEYPNRDEVIAAIVSKQMSSKCDVCGTQDDWLVPTKKEDSEKLEVMMLVKPGHLTSGFAFAPLICLNCGNTRMLHLETLMSARNG